MNTRFAANGKNPASLTGSQYPQGLSRQAPLPAVTNAPQNDAAVLVADGTSLNSEKTNRELFGRHITASDAMYCDGGGI